jgi:hypothetical protein
MSRDVTGVDDEDPVEDLSAYAPLTWRSINIITV